MSLDERARAGIDAVNALAPSQMRTALVFLSGYDPEIFGRVLAYARQQEQCAHE